MFRALGHPPSSTSAVQLPALVVFSHHRWDAMVSRQRELMRRLAQHWRIVFIEEPLQCFDEPVCAQATEAGPNISVVVPRIGPHAGSSSAQRHTVLSALVSHHLRRERVRRPVVWVTTPMAWPLAKTVKPRCVVYDCNEDLAAFSNAPAALMANEDALLRAAALVLAAGPALHEAKRAVHPNVHCVPSAVDATRFAPAAPRARELEEAPVTLGFHGPLDERIDFALLAALADAKPEWRIEMAGPVVGVDETQLPYRANIVWLGEPSGDLLPQLIERWDVGLLPFAANAAARSTNPAQLLDYMAAGKPVVATPLPDVQLLHGDLVRTASHDAAQFAQACIEMLNEPLVARSRREMDMVHAVSACSWDHNAQSIHALIASVLDEAPVPLMARVLPRSRLKKMLPGLPRLAGSGAF